jgi:hypothetical protein
MEAPGGLAGKLASEGMAVFRAADLKEATKLGTDDPTVRSGMLRVEIKTFWVPSTNPNCAAFSMEAIDITPTRSGALSTLLPIQPPAD